jgi:hypothetical protein
MQSHFLASVLFSAALSSAVGSLAADVVDKVKPVFPSEVKITVENGMRIIRANGIPDHNTGPFPNDSNPNTISPQKYEFRVPAEPKAADKPTPYRMHSFGVAVNGVVFDPFAAEWWNGDRNWQYEPMANGSGFLGVDASHAHVQPSGAYHYHAIPTALVYILGDGKDKMVLVGWAADGFPIYNPVGYTDPKDAKSPLKRLKSSYRIKQGNRPDGPGGAYDGKFVADYEYVPGLGDLDECNGIEGVTPEYPKGIYHYVLTDDFPFIPRLYRGTPDPSFERRGPRFAGGQGPGGPGGPGGRRPPIPLIVRALDKNGDGIIDSEEIANAPAALRSLDKRGDGKLTLDEYLGPRPGGAGPQGGPPGNGRRLPLPLLIRAIDTNGDGIITSDEIEHAPEALKKLDTKGDGKLTWDQYMGPRPNRGPGGPNGGPDGPPGAGGAGGTPDAGPGDSSSSRLRLRDRAPAEN